MSDYPISSIRGQAMLSYLPDYYQASRVMRALKQADGSEFDLINKAIEAILRQFYVNLADDWGLEIWEKELSLPPASQETVAERRQRIIAKLRGNGTATIKAIKTLAESYDKGIIDVAEDYSQYTVIRFIDTTGIPSNIDDLKEIVREIVPAHLALEYEYNYFIWDELNAQTWTWDELDALNLTWNKLEVYR